MQQLKLYSSIIFAMIFWSFSFIWTRVAILSFPPVTLITLRLLIASFLLYSISKSAGKFQKLKKKDVKWFLLLAFFEPYMYYMGETFGLTMVEATLASVIIATIPLFAPILAYILIREKISFSNITGILVSLSGVFIVIYRPGSGLNASPLGVGLLFLAVFSAICYTTTLRKISTEYSTFNVIFYQSFFGLLYFIPTFLTLDFKHISMIKVSTEGITALFMLSVFASVIAFVLFAWAVRKMGVAKTNAFVNLIPVFTALFAWFIIGERITLLQWIGIAIVVSGLFVSQLNKFRFRFPFKSIKGTEY